MCAILALTAAGFGWHGSAAFADNATRHGAPAPQPVRNALFTVHLRYTGAEPLRQAVVRIPVPGTNDYQQVYGVTIVPRPVIIEKVPFGGRVAFLVFRDLEPGAGIWIWMRVCCRLRAFEAHKNRAVLPAPWEVHQRCLGRSAKVDPGNPEIRKVAAAIRGQKQDKYAIVRAINRFLAEHFTYDLDGKQDDAVTVLKRRTGSCSEFSRVFVGLARACGIPARFVAGSVVRRRNHPSVDIVHHRWIEVFLPHYGWFPIDISAEVQSGRQDIGFGRIPPSRLVLTRNAGVADSAWFSNSFVLSKPAPLLVPVTRTYWFRANPGRIPEMLRILRHGLRSARNLRRIRRAVFQLKGPEAVPFLAAALYDPIAGGKPEKAVTALAATRCRTAVVPLIDFAAASPPGPLEKTVRAALHTLSGLEFSGLEEAHSWLISPEGLDFLRGKPARKTAGKTEPPAPRAPETRKAMTAGRKGDGP